MSNFTPNKPWVTNQLVVDTDTDPDTDYVAMGENVICAIPHHPRNPNAVFEDATIQVYLNCDPNDLPLSGVVVNLELPDGTFVMAGNTNSLGVVEFTVNINATTSYVVVVPAVLSGSKQLLSSGNFTNGTSAPVSIGPNQTLLLQADYKIECSTTLDNISFLLPDGLAPNIVRVKSTEIGMDDPSDPDYVEKHDNDFRTTFSDAYTYTAPQNVLTNWRNAGYSLSDIADHCYKESGSYAINRTVTNKQTGCVSVAAPKTITLNDKSSVFDDTNTFYISPTLTPNPADPAMLVFATVKNAFDYSINPALSLTRTRYILEANTAHKTLGVRVRDYHPDMCVEFLAGASLEQVNPTQQYMFWFSDANKNFRLINPVVFGDWDPVTETGNFSSKFIFTTGAKTPNILVVDGFLKGMPDNFVISGSGSAGVGGLGLVNTAVDGYANYGAFMGAGIWHSRLGTRIIQLPEAQSGGPKDGFNNAHGCFRNSSQQPVESVVEGCDAYTANGWIANVVIGGVPYYTEQPCERINQEQIAGSVERYLRSSFEGGFNLMANQNKDQSGGAAAGVTNCDADMVVSYCVFVASHMTQSYIALASSGITIKNNLFTVPDVNEIADVFETSEVLALLQPITAGVGLLRNKVAGCTVHDKRTAAVNQQIAYIRDLTTTISPSMVMEDNVLVQPNKGAIADQPLTQADLWPPRSLGYIDINTGVPTVVAGTASPAGGVPESKPLAGNPAIASAVKTRCRDLSGNMRVQPTNRGCW